MLFKYADRGTHFQFQKTFMVSHWVAYMTGDRNSCVKMKKVQTSGYVHTSAQLANASSVSESDRNCWTWPPSASSVYAKLSCWL